MSKTCVLAIDESIIMDEDDFMLNVAYSVFDTAYILVSRGVDTFWMKKETQFQKRIYWELMNTVFFAFPTVSIKVIGVDPIENPDILDILTKGAFDDVRAIQSSDIVMSYVDDKESCACAMTEDAQSKGKEIIDLKKLIAANLKFEEEVKRQRTLMRRKKIRETGMNEFYGIKFD